MRGARRTEWRRGYSAMRVLGRGGGLGIDMDMGMDLGMGTWMGDLGRLGDQEGVFSE